MRPEEIELGIAAPENRLSAAVCLKRAQQRVVFPMLLLIVISYGCILAGLFLSGNGEVRIDTMTSLHPGQLWKITIYFLMFVGALAPLIPAGIWSWRAAQKWRIWALQNVDDWPRLERESQQKFGKWPRSPVSPPADASPNKLLEWRLMTYRDRHDQIR